MGKVWTRDSQGQAQTELQTPNATRRPAPVKRNANVWTRETAASQDGACNGGAHASPPVTTAAGAPDGPEAKRRRLMAKGRLLPTLNGVETGSGAGHKNTREDPSDPMPDAQPHRAEQGADRLNAVRLEAMALRRRIADEERRLNAAKEAARQKEANEAAAERERRETQQLRKRRLDAGFAEAFKATRELAASQKAPKVGAADAAEVRRVLAAKSDHEVMQLQIGADRDAVKKKYRSMTLALHPDKCKAESATDAFQRLVLAYQGVLKHAR